jgi:hypothetical protein
MRPRAAQLSAALKTAAVALLGLACSIGLSGCFIPVAIGGAVESYKKDSKHWVDPETDVLDGKTYAVVATAGRMIQADHPALLDNIILRFQQRLAQAGIGTGQVDTADLLKFLYNRPDWVARPLGDLAKDLGVDALVFVEITEFRLQDPGNQYLWNGVAAGNVQVIHADPILGEQQVFLRAVRVKFPDKDGFGPNDFSAAQISSVLLARFMDRASWPFYRHEEPYYPEY